MEAKAPMIVSAAASCHGRCAAATRRPAAPRPRKKMTIMARRPHRSPRRPAGSEPRPKSTNAPTVYGIRSCQTMPHSAAMADTAVAKMSRNRWSMAWPTLRSRAVGLVLDMAGSLPHTRPAMSPDQTVGPTLDAAALDLLFRQARTHRAWLDRPVPDELLRRVYELAALGPTSANCSPMRVLFVKSREAKERLRPALSPGNVDKTMQAPVTAIIAYDLAFPDRLPRLFPTADMRANFVGKPELIATTAFRNGTLQGAYLMLAA